MRRYPARFPSLIVALKHTHGQSGLGPTSFVCRRTDLFGRALWHRRQLCSSLACSGPRRIRSPAVCIRCTGQHRLYTHR